MFVTEEAKPSAVPTNSHDSRSIFHSAKLSASLSQLLHRRPNRPEIRSDIFPECRGVDEAWQREAQLPLVTSQQNWTQVNEIIWENTVKKKQRPARHVGPD